MTPTALAFYGRQCGWTLARAHARSGDPIAITAYLGKSDEFDQSVADFSEHYADQNERDFEQVHQGHSLRRPGGDRRSPGRLDGSRRSRLRGSR